MRSGHCTACRSRSRTSRRPRAFAPRSALSRTSSGSRTSTLAIWQRLKAAGAILIGKTTTPEFAHSSFTESPLWGITRNPWNRERTPGGSSGGAGAAVAVGCVPLAEGTDMGGSVRIPAAFCGVVGLKPSLGRIPMDILPTVFNSISHFGPLARTVEDAALFLAITAGPHDADIQSLPEGPDPRGRLGEEIAGKRLAYSPDLGFFAVEAEVRREVEAAIQALAEAGAIVEEVDLPWDRSVMDDWALNWGVLLAACFGQHLERFRDKMTPAVVRLIEQGRAIDAVTLRRLEFARTRRWHQLAALFERHDALLCPTMVRTATPVGGTDEDFAGDDENGRFLGLDMTGPSTSRPSARRFPCRPAGATRAFRSACRSSAGASTMPACSRSGRRWSASGPGTTGAHRSERRN